MQMFLGLSAKDVVTKDMDKIYGEKSNNICMCQS